MARTFVSVLGALLIVGIGLAGCGSKKTQSVPATETPVAEASATPANGAIGWSYDQPPSPPIDGVPDRMVVSFGFDKGAAVLKQEARGACREAVRRLEEIGDYRLAVIGFACGIDEKQSAEKLGLERARAAQAFLTGLGVPADRVQVTGFGATYSRARDFEKVKMARERKVEIWLLR